MTRPADDAVLLDLARTVVGISTRAAGRLGGVSVTQLRALTVIAAAGGGRTGLLAAELGISASSASRLADRLVLAGLVRRETAVTDRREVHLRPTPDGLRLLEHYDELRLTELRALLDAVPEPSSVVGAIAQLVGGRRPAGVAR